MIPFIHLHKVMSYISIIEAVEDSEFGNWCRIGMVIKNKFGGLKEKIIVCCMPVIIYASFVEGLLEI